MRFATDWGTKASGFLALGGFEGEEDLMVAGLTVRKQHLGLIRDSKPP